MQVWVSRKRGLHMAGMRMLLVHILVAVAKSNYLQLRPLPNPLNSMTTTARPEITIVSV
jgi:hypothetical protein